MPASTQGEGLGDSPAFHGLASLVLPGSGQLMQEQRLAAATHFTIFAGAVAVMALRPA